MSYEKSQQLMNRARKVMPGGVNSPVRAFTSVGGTAPFISRAEGPYMWDEDDNKYIDFVLTWGPAILGHANEHVVGAAQEAVALGSSFGAPTEREIDIAAMLVDRVPGLDVVRLVNSGTEACMSAIRLARGATARDKIIKFEGCYHGHSDSFLIAAGSGALTLGVPNSPGVTEGTAKDTLLAKFNDIASVEALVEEHGAAEIAAIILEPITGNTGCIPPKDGFLTDLRELCDHYGIALILDEVMTGFRVARGGAAELYDVEADIYCFGKVMGGGFPMAAYGGTEEYMRHMAPDGPVYQAGTLSGNPVAVAAGIATLSQLDANAYATLDGAGERLQEGMQTIIDTHNYPLTQHRVGSMFSLFFSDSPIENHDDVKACDIQRFNAYFHEMLDRGVYLAPSQFEAGFLSVMHDDAIIDAVLERAEDALASVF